MVTLQDLANIALIVAVAANVIQFFYGPLAKRRADQRALKEETSSDMVG